MACASLSTSSNGRFLGDLCQNIVRRAVQNAVDPRDPVCFEDVDQRGDNGYAAADGCCEHQDRAVFPRQAEQLRNMLRDDFLIGRHDMLARASAPAYIGQFGFGPPRNADDHADAVVVRISSKRSVSMPAGISTALFFIFIAHEHFGDAERVSVIVEHFFCEMISYTPWPTVPKPSNPFLSCRSFCYGFFKLYHRT
jgi:hypothetical protein